MAKLKAFWREKDQLKRIVAEFELDKLILKDSLDFKTEGLTVDQLRQAVVVYNTKAGNLSAPHLPSDRIVKQISLCLPL